MNISVLNQKVRLNERLAINFNRFSFIVDKLVCRFTDKTLQMKNCVEEWVDTPLSLNYVCQQKVIKLPFKPKYGDKYWSYVTPKFNIVESVWINGVFDFTLLKCGCVFRTEAEAIKARPQKYKELTGKDYVE